MPMTIPTPEEAYEQMDRIASHDDQETQHIKADGYMCELLTLLGYQDMVEAFLEMPKWYA